MRRGSGDKGKKAFTHVQSRQHRARRLRRLQEVVSGESGAEYLVRHLPDRGQMVLTPVDGGGEWCSTHCTIHVGEDRRSGVAHPLVAPVQDGGAVPHSPFSGRSTIGGRVGHHAAACAARIGGVCRQDGG